MINWLLWMSRDLSSYFFPPFMPPTATFINHSYCYYRHHLLQPASWALTFTSFNNTMPIPPPTTVSLSLSLSLCSTFFLAHQFFHSSTFLFLISCLCHFCLWNFDNGFLFYFFIFPPFCKPPQLTSLSEWHTPGEEISSGLAAKKKLNKAFLQGDCSESVCVCVFVWMFAVMACW